ncbi:hypothetical protein LTR36_010111 [Oleoguttula mirabilis]|uniref:Enoyl reductase (ER) domain-containing protein n=1 Tax=Oleoguttula mirabilis TaxID=1507867 RepID=A0AAV9JT78_9PEZI|nr:hypothetical protein LTR36_010111 [Oleoguttula mirabilis]
MANDQTSGNQAAWLDSANKQLRVAEAETPKPGADDVIIRNFAVAVNPVDWKIQDSGAFIKQWPMILGCDVAGEIAEVGSDVKAFKKGDRVLAHATSLLSSNAQEGGFQLYTKSSSKTTALIPGDITYAAASVLPLALDTAIVGLCSPAEEGKGLGLPFPSLDPKPSGKTIVVWGGSSSVGALCIQLATAAGAKVVAVSSSANFDFCKRCGATEVCDYKKADTVVEDVVKAVKSAGGEFAGVYDAISIQDQSYKYTLPVLEKLGGGVLSVVLGGPKDPPSSVKVGNVFGINPLTHPVWEKYITQALEQGKLMCLPEPLVVGKGLEAVQKGLDKNKEGVSARKVVIEL